MPLQFWCHHQNIEVFLNRMPISLAYQAAIFPLHTVCEPISPAVLSAEKPAFSRKCQTLPHPSPPQLQHYTETWALLLIPWFVCNPKAPLCCVNAVTPQELSQGASQHLTSLQGGQLPTAPVQHWKQCCWLQIPHLTGTNDSRRRQAPSQPYQPREQHVCTSTDTELQVSLDAFVLKQPIFMSANQTANTKHLISI